MFTALRNSNYLDFTGNLFIKGIWFGTGALKNQKRRRCRRRP